MPLSFSNSKKNPRNGLRQKMNKKLELVKISLEDSKIIRSRKMRKYPKSLGIFSKHLTNV
jgi:hypothetical protein